MKSLFKNHIDQVCQQTTSNLEATASDRLIVDCGDLSYFFNDDQSKPFTPNPLFNYFCPLKSHGHMISFEPGQKPVLYYFQPEDFWYDVQPLAQEYWTDCFDIKVMPSRDEIWKKLVSNKRTTFVGPESKELGDFDFRVNPDDFVARFDWQRSFKTDYEIECTRKAQELAAKGHTAAKDSFFNGDSELEIFHNYMSAIGGVDYDLPYNAIVALNEKSAILHYENKRHNRNGKVLLIDAGARHQQYCSDITRTYASNDAHTTFKELTQSMDQLQKKLCDMIKPGQPYPELHHQANVEIFECLKSHDIIKDIDLDSAIENDVIKTFFPHGLGHMLGIQVHDVGGHQTDETGASAPAPERYPKLRTTRLLEERVLLTVEPGVYFIPILLDKIKATPFHANINWKLVDELVPLGGIRVEDNVVVTQKGSENLTRPYLP